MRETSGALCAALTVAIALTAGAQGIIKNTRRVAFVPLPSSAAVQGLWGYEAGGKRYCLQTRDYNGLTIVETTDPKNPKVVGQVPGRYRKVATYKNYAYAIDDGGPTNIIDLTDPTRPTIVRSMPITAHTLRVGGDRLFLNREFRGSLIYDLKADPTSPRAVGIWAGSDAHDCRPVGNTLYVNGIIGTPTRIVDISNPMAPVPLGTVAAGNHSSDFYVAPDGRKILCTCDERVGGHLGIFDVSTPGRTTSLASYRTSAATSIHNVEVHGAYAYISYYQDQLRILDIRDPNRPVEVGVWDNNPTNAGLFYSDAWDVYPYHDAIYMGQMTNTPAGPQGLQVIDFFPGFGEGSAGTGSRVPEIWWSFGPPSPGNARFGVRLENARPNTFCVLLLGLSRTRWGSLALPAPLGRFGAPNATLHVSADVWLPAGTDAAGEAHITLPVPANAPFVVFYAQWMVFDGGAPNAARLAFSRAGELVVW